MTTEAVLTKIQILASAGFFIAAALVAASLSFYIAGSQIVLDSVNGTSIVDPRLYSVGTKLQSIAWPYWIYATIALAISIFGSFFWIDRITKKIKNNSNEGNQTQKNTKSSKAGNSESIYKNSIIFAGILSVMLILVYFVTVPLHDDFKINPLNIIEILLAIFLTLFIFHIDYSLRKRKRESKNMREKKAHSMLRDVFSIQSQLLADLKQNPTQQGRLTLTNTPITNAQFVERAFPANNEEIVRILSIFSDVIEDNLLQQLLHFATYSSFYFTTGAQFTTQGIDVIIKKVTDVVALIPNDNVTTS